MLITLLLSLISATFPVLTEKDFQSKEIFLIYLFFKRDKFVCHSCEVFTPILSKLEIPVKVLNFAENIKLGSRFLIHTFPAFILRSSGRSYIIDPNTPEELIDIIQNEKWKEISPMRKYLDVTSVISIIFSYLNRLIFFFIESAYKLIDFIPESAITFVVTFIIVYLIYSIIEIFLRKDNSNKNKEN